MRYGTSRWKGAVSSARKQIYSGAPIGALAKVVTDMAAKVSYPLS